jgi:hypothetical protein
MGINNSQGEDAVVRNADSINEIIDVNEEDDPDISKKLTEISKKHDAVLMACIAPLRGTEGFSNKNSECPDGSL